MELFETTPEERKTVFQIIIHFCSIFASYVLGWFNRISIVAAYPYSAPQSQGWAGLAGFLGMYGIIGGVTVIKRKTNPNQKRSLWILVVTIIVGIGAYIYGFVEGIKNPNYFTAGTLYGAYRQKKI